jgi:PTS system galactitol-specific IIC component
MSTISAIFSTLVAVLGNVVIVPIVVLIVGLIFGMRFSRALRAGLTVGVGFIGVYTILTLFLNSLSPVATAIAERTGGAMRLDMVDLGWPAPFTAAMKFPIVLSYVLIGVLLNLVLVLTGRVKTLGVSLAEPILGQGLIGYGVYSITHNYWYGLIAALVIYVLSLLLADWQQPYVEKFFGFKGISLIQVGVNEWGLLAWPISRLLDKIPFLREGRFTPEYVAEKFGVVGEPLFIGLVFGAGLGILGGYEWTAVVLLAMNLAAALHLMPKMVGVIMEGFILLQEASRDFLQKRTSGREIYLGMDPALGTGHASILATVMVMIPITILIAIVLPGNRVLPLGDLPTLVFILMFCVVMNRGDILRSVITSIIVTPILLWSATLAGPYVHALLLEAGMVEQGAVTSLALFNGAELYWYPLMRLAEGQLWPIAVFVVAIALGWLVVSLSRRSLKAEAAAEAAKVEASS